MWHLADRLADLTSEWVGRVERASSALRHAGVTERLPNTALWSRHAVSDFPFHRMRWEIVVVAAVGGLCTVPV